MQPVEQIDPPQINVRSFLSISVKTCRLICVFGPSNRIHTIVRGLICMPREREQRDDVQMLPHSPRSHPVLSAQIGSLNLNTRFIYIGNHQQNTQSRWSSSSTQRCCDTAWSLPFGTRCCLLIESRRGTRTEKVGGCVCVLCATFEIRDQLRREV